MESRRNPFEMFDEMERMFDQMRRSMWGGAERYGDRSLPAAGDYEFSQDSNVSLQSTDDGYVVLADLPGFEKEEIDLQYDDGVLSIIAVHGVTDEGYARSRSVRESVTVPGDVDVEGIEATYRNGVLEIHVPVDEEADDALHIDID